MTVHVNIIGAGGHARSLINLVELNGLRIDGIYDDSFSDAGERELINGYPVLGTVAAVPANVPAILAVGDNGRRRSLFNTMGDRVYEKNLVHATTVIEKRTSLDKSNQIFGMVYINSMASVGNDNILNSGCILEHEVTIGDHNHISVGTVLCGRVRIGSCCFIGAGSVVIDKITIGDNIIIGANSVVIEDITSPGTYAGNPARKIK